MRVLSDFALRGNFSPSFQFFSTAQLKLDSLQVSASNQASDFSLLTAMAAASATFSLGRVLGTSLFSGMVSGFGLRVSSWTLGFLGEIAAFRGVSQAFHPEAGSCFEARSFASTAADFLMLKGAGALMRSSSFMLRNFVQATAVVGGEYAGEGLGLREKTHKNFSDRYVHALAAGVAMDMAGAITIVMTGGTMKALERNLERNLENGFTMQRPRFRASSAAERMSLFSAERQEFFQVLADLRNQLRSLSEETISEGFRREMEDTFFDRLLSLVNPQGESPFKGQPTDIPHALEISLGAKLSIVELSEPRASTDRTAFANHVKHRNELLQGAIDYLIQSLRSSQLPTARRRSLEGKLAQLIELNNQGSIASFIPIISIFGVGDENRRGLVEAILAGVKDITIPNPRSSNVVIRIQVTLDQYGRMVFECGSVEATSIPSMD